MIVSGSAVSLNEIEVVGINGIFAFFLMVSFGVGIVIAHFAFAKIRG